jgi:hypothetical protein
MYLCTCLCSNCNNRTIWINVLNRQYVCKPVEDFMKKYVIYTQHILYKSYNVFKNKFRYGVTSDINVVTSMQWCQLNTYRASHEYKKGVTKIDEYVTKHINASQQYRNGVTEIQKWRHNNTEIASHNYINASHNYINASQQYINASHLCIIASQQYKNGVTAI